ncbi:GNAT family N-acetyltransferase-like protein [Phanerochaete sordida]|uniref:GNAT family N-acetyltransferase-like protein n=1 Tax=Phanerochaete sordida TaxID=48140 RepID=A0A9P3GQG4_9APHY|nr:GNAT family N-acetyltransferase-like protein [Phanerochaete sordida]
MAIKFTIRRLQAPTEDELHQIGLVLSEAMNKDSICIDGSANDMKLYYDLCRACSSAAAAEAHLFAAFLEGTNEVIGSVTFYEPGKVLMGDEKQRAHGFDTYLESLPPQAQRWWATFLPQYGAVVDAKLGPGVKDAAWTVNSFGVQERYRCQGVGRALFEAGEKYAKASKAMAIVETEQRHNVPIYEHLGYSLIDWMKIDGQGQNPDFDLAVLRRDFA